MHILCTATVASFQETNPNFPKILGSILERHFNEDWGDLCEEDKETNIDATISGARIMSVYKNEFGGPEEKVWVISDAADPLGNRITTVLFPSEY